MQINKVTRVSGSPAVYSNSTKKVQSKDVSFGSFESIMKNAYAIDMTKTSSVNLNFREIYKVLLREREITIKPIMKTLQSYCDFANDDIQKLLKELCRPMAKIKSNLRDIVYESRERDIPLITKGYSNALYIENYGKYGFFNRLFDSESAGNDVRLTLKSDNYKYQVGLDKDGWLKLRQEWGGSDWKESEYWVFNRRSHKTGANISGHIAFTP